MLPRGLREGVLGHPHFIVFPQPGDAGCECICDEPATIRCGSVADTRRTDLANTATSLSGPGEPTTVVSEGLGSMLVVVRVQERAKIDMPLSTADGGMTPSSNLTGGIQCDRGRQTPAGDRNVLSLHATTNWNL